MRTVILHILKTHYYGGIKKYQWTTIPLALHGVATLQDGTQIQISIGEEDDDPTFVISDFCFRILLKTKCKETGRSHSRGKPEYYIGKH